MLLFCSQFGPIHLAFVVGRQRDDEAWLFYPFEPVPLVQSVPASPSRSFGRYCYRGSRISWEFHLPQQQQLNCHHQRTARDGEGTPLSCGCRGGQRGALSIVGHERQRSRLLRAVGPGPPGRRIPWKRWTRIGRGKIIQGGGAAGRGGLEEGGKP